VDLHTRVDGPADAPPLLLINSLGSTLDLWSTQAAAWAGRFRVIRYDMRGHGRSPAPGGEYSLDDLGEDAVRVLDAVGVQQAHVCGISIGGLTTMWLGVHRPERVRKLVIANTAAKVGTRERWLERAAKVKAEGLGPIADLNMTTWFTGSFRSAEPAVIDTFHRMVAGNNPAGYVGCCAALRDADLREAISGIAAPTLVVAGANDPTTSVADGEFIRSQIPGASLLTLPAAHLSNVECADAFSRIAGAFLS
jgi:3-oxoadipate enol-lactonase